MSLPKTSHLEPSAFRRRKLPSQPGWVSDKAQQANLATSAVSSEQVLASTEKKIKPFRSWVETLPNITPAIQPKPHKASKALPWWLRKGKKRPPCLLASNLRNEYSFPRQSRIYHDLKHELPKWDMTKHKAMLESFSRNFQLDAVEDLMKRATEEAIANGTLYVPPRPIRPDDSSSVSSEEPCASTSKDTQTTSSVTVLQCLFPLVVGIIPGNPRFLPVKPGWDILDELLPLPCSFYYGWIPSLRECKEEASKKPRYEMKCVPAVITPDKTIYELSEKSMEYKLIKTELENGTIMNNTAWHLTPMDRKLTKKKKFEKHLPEPRLFYPANNFEREICMHYLHLDPVTACGWVHIKPYTERENLFVPALKKASGTIEVIDNYWKAASLKRVIQHLNPFAGCLIQDEPPQVMTSKYKFILSPNYVARTGLLPEVITMAELKKKYPVLHIVRCDRCGLSGHLTQYCGLKVYHNEMKPHYLATQSTLQQERQFSMMDDVDSSSNEDDAYFDRHETMSNDDWGED